MLPILVSIGPIKISSYIVILALGIFLASYVIWKRGRELYFDEDELLETTLGMLVVFGIGSRLGFLLFGEKPEANSWWEWIGTLLKPGYLYVGGFILMLSWLFWLVKRKHWDLYLLGDVLSVGWTVILAFSMFGLFLTGSGAGNPTESIFGIHFPGMYEKRLPVQIISSLLYGGLFVGLWKLENNYRTIGWYKGNRSEAYPGFILGMFLVGHGMIEFLLSWFKPSPWVFYGVAVDRIFYLGLVGLGLGIIYKRSDLNWFGARRGGRAKARSNSSRWSRVRR